MQHLNLEQAADYIEAAIIESTTDIGHAIIHTGTSTTGARFVLVNDCHGQTMLSEAV